MDPSPFCNYLEELQQGLALSMPDTTVKVILTNDTANPEAFELKSSGAITTLKAASPLAAAYGLNQLSAGSASGHLAELLGKNAPSFSLRPVWLMHYTSIRQLDSTQKIEKICRRLIEWGCNAIMLGCQEDEIGTQEADSYFNALTLFHDFHLKVILKPQLSLNNDWLFHEKEIQTIQAKLIELQQKASAIDYLFWEGTFWRTPQHLMAAKQLLQRDLANKEVSLLEECLKHPSALIYYIPWQGSHHSIESWFSSFLDDVGSNTLVAFPAVAGEMTADHAASNPIWRILRQSPDISLTKLLPVVNVGSVQQGEGLWPAIALDLIENYFSRCYRHSFAGALSLVNRLPKQGSLLDCSLWCASRFLWKPQAPHLLAETWFSAFRPELPLIKYFEFFREVREISLIISLLRCKMLEKIGESDQLNQCRVLAENAAIRLKALQLFLKQQDQEEIEDRQLPGLRDHAALFVQEAKKISFHFLHSSSVLLTVDHGENPVDNSLPDKLSCAVLED